MTWQDPGGNPPPGAAGDPDEDATLTDLNLSELDAGLAAGPPEGESAGAPPPAAPPSLGAPGQPAGPPPAPGAPPAYPAFPEPGASPVPGHAPGYAPGYVPGYPPATAPGMAWAPPPTSGAGYGVPGAGGLEYAGAGERFVAWLLDVILISFVGGAIAFVLTMLVGGYSYDSFGYFPGVEVSPDAFGAEIYGPILVAGFIAAVIATLIDLAYFVLQWASGARATLGMRLLGLQVGNAADGRTLDRGQALRRWFAMGSWLDVVSALPVVGLLVALGQLIWYVVLLVTTANDPRRQGLHDRFAGTAVVKEAGRSNSGIVVGCIVIAVLIVVVLPIISLVALVFLGGQVTEILSTMGNSI